MSEMLILLGVALSSLFLTDPFYGGALTKSSIAKGVVLALIGGPLLLHLAGRFHREPRVWQRVLSDVLATWWPITLLGLLITFGSLYAREVRHVEETFLNMGIGMLFLPLMAMALEVSERQTLLLRGLLVIYVVTALTMFAVAAAKLHVLHEQIFWAAPLGMYFLMAQKSSWIRVPFGLTLLGLSLLAFKNTTFLLVLMCITVWVMFLLLRLSRQSDGLKALVTVYFTVLTVVTLSATAAVGWWMVRDTLPHGNVSYRVEMYAIAWQRFLSSPVFGTLFAEPSVSYFSLYKVAVSTQYLPTHSDILDLLAHGGVIAFSLWLATAWTILRIAYHSFVVLARGRTGADDTAWRWLMVLALAQIGAIVTYAVNPPLIRLLDGFWIWGGAGVLWFLHRRLIASPHPQVPAGIPQPHPPRVWGIKPLARPKAQ